MKVFIYPNFKKKNTEKTLSDVCSYLDKFGAQILMDSIYSETNFEKTNVHFADFDSQISSCDVIIAIGGDGTIIHILKHAIFHDKPVLGINAGRLGFLAQLEHSQLDMLKELVDGKFSTEERICISNNIDANTLAVNEITLKSNSSKLVDLKLYCDDKFVGDYRSDGIILSTPTGSTAYSMSAGGPITDPAVGCLLLTPICPHLLTSRTIIFSGDRKIKIECSKENRADVCLSVDGEDIAVVNPGSSVSFEVSSKSAKLITFNKKEFYEILNKKLSERE